MNDDISTRDPGIGGIDTGDAKSLATVVYLLQALGLFVGITLIAGVIVNYLKRDQVAGTWVASHFTWQIRTFWWSLLWTVLGSLTAVLVVGYLVLAANGVWLIYRIVRGWLALNEGREIRPA